MLIPVKIVAASETTRTKPYNRSNGSVTVELSREIYTNFSSIIDCSSMTYHSKPRSKFEEFMKDFNNLYFAENGLTDEETENLILVDEFFGLLSKDNPYPIVRDAVGNQRAVSARYYKLNTRK